MEWKLKRAIKNFLIKKQLVCFFFGLPSPQNKTKTKQNDEPTRRYDHNRKGE